jgi:molybdenum cofactor biosynthesis protein B
LFGQGYSQENNPSLEGLAPLVNRAGRKADMMAKPTEMHSGSHEHHEKSNQKPPVKIAIITVSDSRTEETDVNGTYLKAEIKEKGYSLAAYRLVRDEPAEVESVLEALAQSDVQVILFNGGTGISRRDTTFDTLSRKLEKTLPGFGELFRQLSYLQIGAAAMFSRATAGVYQGKAVFSTPGSPAAVQLAWEKLIQPELQHIAWEITR